MHKKFRGAVLLPLLCIIQIACGEPSVEKSPSIGDEVFLRVGGSSLSTEEFNAAVEIAKIPYGENASGNPGLLASIRRQTLAELVSEMVMSQRAEELGLGVSKEAVAEAVNAIESDFPEGVLDAILFKNVVKRKVWEKRLAARLLMEKLVDAELKQKSAATAAEIVDFYRKTMPQTRFESRDIDPTLVAGLLREKAEERFEPWLHQLIKAYPIYVDQNVWERIVGGQAE